MHPEHLGKENFWLVQQNKTAFEWSLLLMQATAYPLDVWLGSSDLSLL